MSESPGGGPPVSPPENLEISLREFLDDDDALSVVQVILAAGWIACPIPEDMAYTEELERRVERLTRERDNATWLVGEMEDRLRDGATCGETAEIRAWCSQALYTAGPDVPERDASGSGRWRG